MAVFWLAHNENPVAMKEVKVRGAIERDFPAIKSITEKHNLTLNKYFTISPPDSPNSLLEREDRVIFVATSASTAIGFLNLHCNGSFRKNCHEAEFEIVVDPDHRINGVGSKLLNEAIKYITSRTVAEIFVAKIKNGNIGSERLCEKFGFSKKHQDSIGAYWELEIKR